MRLGETASAKAPLLVWWGKQWFSALNVKAIRRTGPSSESLAVVPEACLSYLRTLRGNGALAAAGAPGPCNTTASA